MPSVFCVFKPRFTNRMEERARDRLESVLQLAVARAHWLNLENPDTIKPEDVEVHWVGPEKSDTTDDVGFHILFSYDLAEAVRNPSVCKMRITTIRKSVMEAISECKLLPRGRYGIWARPQFGGSFESFTIP